MLVYYLIVHKTWYYIGHLLYLLNLFLNMSASILYFFNRQMVCSITILFLEWLLLCSFSTCDNSLFLFFLFGNDDSCSGKSLSTPRYPRSTTLTTCFSNTCMGNESVSKEDRERLEQLSGEIMERIRVVADILAVSIDKKSGEPIKKFSIFVTPKSSNKNVNMVDIVWGWKY